VYHLQNLRDPVTYDGIPELFCKQSPIRQRVTTFCAFPRRTPERRDFPSKRGFFASIFRKFSAGSGRPTRMPDPNSQLHRDKGVTGGIRPDLRRRVDENRVHDGMIRIEIAPKRVYLNETHHDIGPF